MDSDLAFCLNDFAQQLNKEHQQNVAKSIYALVFGSPLALGFSGIFEIAAITGAGIGGAATAGVSISGTISAGAGIVGASIRDARRGFSNSSTTIFDVSQKRMNKKWNRIYDASVQQINDEKMQRICWKGSIDRGGKPYFCPKGWKRYGIKVADTADEFDRRWGQWCVAYHGTEDTNATSILSSGLRANNGIHGTLGKCVYVLPSIEYSAHPRYAKVRHDPKTGKYHQMIFQCRVNPRSVNIVGDTTMALEWRNEVKIDPNFDNKELEWIIEAPPNVSYIRDDIICYGIMLRTTNVRPGRLPSSHWWQYSNASLQEIVKPWI